jgi:DNA polymerase-3 subunit gamma/tau
MGKRLLTNETSSVSASKFRPRTFSEIIGQAHISRALSHALESKRIAHGYLFSGTRGVGKTTTARILAKALNCVKGPTATPCLECGNCRDIAAGVSMDVMEIDGASNSGVDNIRDLRDGVRFSPTNSRYKVYIIDEVHQISKQAFNALLKTLEEPPAHVVFIFATTELNKVPDTIVSRCQCFEYRAISHADIVRQLEMICAHDGIKAVPAALDMLARRARGSMRDAQSLFDQSSAYGGGVVAEEDVKTILGLTDRSVLFGAIDAAIRGDQAALFDIADKVAYTGNDPALFLEELSELLLAVVSAKMRPARALSLHEDEKEPVAGWAEKITLDDAQRWFNALASTMEETRRSRTPSISLTMGLLKLADKRKLTKIDDLLAQIAMAETAPAAQNPAATQASRSEGPKEGWSFPLETNVEPAPRDIARAVSAGGDIQSQMMRSFKNARPMLIGMLEHAELQVKDSTYVLTVNSLFDREQLDVMATRKSLEEIAEKTAGRPLRQVVVFHDEKKKDEPGAVANVEQEGAIRRQLADSPIIQNALEIFNGEISKVHVKRDIKLGEEG